MKCTPLFCTTLVYGSSCCINVGDQSIDGLTRFEEFTPPSIPPLVPLEIMYKMQNNNVWRFRGERYGEDRCKAVGSYGTIHSSNPQVFM